jgi:hypothetical protein
MISRTAKVSVAWSRAKTTPLPSVAGTKATLVHETLFFGTN